MPHRSIGLLLSVGMAVVLSRPSMAGAQAGPDLVIAMSHTGNFTVGENGVYTIVVSNIGGTATSGGQPTVSDELPNALQFVSARVLVGSAGIRLNNFQFVSPTMT
jgi:uncharacterized repeat protein (TIGR01451 family)